MSVTCYGSWMSMAPELLLLGTALLLVLLGRSGAEKDGESMGYISFLGMAGALACVLVELGATVRRPLGGLMIVDGLADFFTVFILAAAMLVALMAAHAARDAGQAGGKRHLFVPLSAAGMLLMVKGLDLLVIALGLAVCVVAECFLARSDAAPEVEPQTVRSHLRLGSLSLGAFLLGVLVLHQGTGTTNLEGIGAALSAPTLPRDPLLLQGMVLLLAGLGIPLALVPFHGWVLRLAHGASPAVIAWLDVGSKAAAVAVIARIWATASALAGEADMVVCVLAIATMGLGNLAALGETDLARMLMYGGIAHAGYLLLGVIAGGTLGWAAVLYYVVTYGFMSLGALAMVLWCAPQGGGRLEVGALAGLGVRSPALGAALGMFLLALAGIPPLTGFMAKLFIFSAAMNSGRLWLAVIGAAHCLVSAYCCLRVVAALYLEEPREEVACVVEGPVLVAAVIALAGTLLAGLWPGPLLNWALESVRWLVG